MAGQVNTVIHVLGILVSLPFVLDPGEKVLSLSLGAGTTKAGTPKQEDDPGPSSGCPSSGTTTWRRPAR